MSLLTYSLTVQAAYALAFWRINDSFNTIESTMLLIQNVLGQSNQPQCLSHIWSHTKLPRILAKGNGKTYAIIMTASIELLEQTRMLHQQFCLYPQNLHKLLPELVFSQCKYLSRSCTNWTPLVPLGLLKRAVINPHDLLPKVICPMNFTHHVPFGNLRCLYVVIVAYLGSIYALARSGEKGN